MKDATIARLRLRKFDAAFVLGLAPDEAENPTLFRAWRLARCLLEKPCTACELAAELGFSEDNCRKILQVLRESSDLPLETEKTSTGGRPGIAYSLLALSGPETAKAGELFVAAVEPREPSPRTSYTQKREQPGVDQGGKRFMLLSKQFESDMPRPRGPALTCPHCQSERIHIRSKKADPYFGSVAECFCTMCLKKFQIEEPNGT